MSKEYAFGIDLGGTTAKVGLFRVSGELVEKWEVPTDTADNGSHILPTLAASVQHKMAEKQLTAEQVLGVGIGVPGPVVNDASLTMVCANLGGFGGLNVADALSEMLGGLPVKVGNDANVAALGEIWQGTAKGCHGMVMVTLGTGVGGGIIVDGKVICGAHGAGGEIGHITVNPHETACCGCGKTGCLEQYSSATGIVRGMKQILDKSSEPSVLRGRAFEAKDVLDAARDGDALAMQELNSCANYLGFAMAGIAANVDPEMFLLGGGVSRAGDVLVDAVTQAYKKYSFSAIREIPIKVASLGNDAGIYGAVRLIKGE